MTPLPQRSAEIKVEWLGGDWPWVSGKLSPVFSPPGWLLTDYEKFSEVRRRCLQSTIRQLAYMPFSAQKTF